MKLPKGWRRAQLGRLLITKPDYGANASAIPFIESETLRFLRITDIDDCGRLLTDPKVGIDPALAKGSEVDEGDLLIARTGATVGKSYLVQKLPYPSAFAGYLIRFKIDYRLSHKEFLLQFLRSPYYWKWVATTLRAGAQPNINSQEFCSLPIPLPPLPEQRKIADILTTWDEALDRLDALIDAQERRKKALMQQLLTGKKRVKGARGKWKKMRMGDVLERVFRPIDWHPDLPLNLVSLRRRCGGLFRRPEVKGSEYKTQDLHEIRAGDFLISKRQVVHGAWGYVTPEFEGGHVSKEYAILDNRAPDKLHTPFFAWLAQTRRLIRLARVSSTGVHIEKLIFDPEVFLRESIRIPADLDEQQRIAAILETADQQITLLRAQRTAIDQQKRGLMQRLLTGKIRVKT